MRDAATGGAYADEVYLQFEYDDGPAVIGHSILVTRLSDDTPVAALRKFRFDGCEHETGIATPLTLIFGAPLVDGTEALLLGDVDAKGGTVSWEANWLPDHGGSTAFDWSGGAGVTFSDGTVRTVSALDAPDWNVADAVRSYVAAGHDDTAFWSTTSPTGDVIRGFGSSGTVATFVAQAADDRSFAVSDDKLVWFGTHGPDTHTGTYDAVEVYWSPRPETPADVVIHTGPSIPYRHGFLWAKTGGDYVATLVSNDTGPTYVLVVQLSTGKTWSIPPRPSSAWFRVMAVSPTEIVVAEIDPTAKGVDAIEIQRLLRFDVTQLDSISTAW